MQWTTINSKNVDGLTFVPATFPLTKPDAILIEGLDIQCLVDYIQKKGLKKAYIQAMGNFNFLRSCSTLEYITIELILPFSEYKKAELKGDKIYKRYDLEPMFSLPHLKSLIIINNEPPYVKAKVRLDISRLDELQLYYGNSSYVTNISESYSLKTMILSNYAREDLQELNKLKQIDTLQFTFSKLLSLNGAECLPHLQCVYLHYNRSLRDINALSKVKGTLRDLKIENCSKIEDFSVLGELENLEALELWGSNTLPNLDFLNVMTKLKFFSFSMNVINGDLTPCLKVSHVYSDRNHKHYNLKNEELPKGKFLIEYSGIEEWRRL